MERSHGSLESGAESVAGTEQNPPEPKAPCVPDSREVLGQAHTVTGQVPGMRASGGSKSKLEQFEQHTNNDTAGPRPTV